MTYGFEISVALGDRLPSSIPLPQVPSWEQRASETVPSTGRTARPQNGIVRWKQGGRRLTSPLSLRGKQDASLLPRLGRALGLFSSSSSKGRHWVALFCVASEALISSLRTDSVIHSFLVHRPIRCTLRVPTHSHPAASVSHWPSLPMSSTALGTPNYAKLRQESIYPVLNCWYVYCIKLKTDFP